MRQQQRLDELELDVAILEVAPAVKRLAASAEAIEQHRRDLAEANADVATETEQVERFLPCVARIARGIV